MSIGDKQKRIRIEQQTATSDGHGGSTITWSPRCVVWAHERPLSGTEALRAAQVTAVLSSVLIIWFRTDVRATDRVMIGARTLQVESYYDADDTRKELTLICSEVQL